VFTPGYAGLPRRGLIWNVAADFFYILLQHQSNERIWTESNKNRCPRRVTTWYADVLLVAERRRRWHKIRSPRKCDYLRLCVVLIVTLNWILTHWSCPGNIRTNLGWLSSTFCFTLFSSSNNLKTLMSPCCNRVRTVCMLCIDVCV